MADCVADSVVAFLLKKLDKLLVEEVQLLSGVEDDIQWIKIVLEGTKAILKNADKRREIDEVEDIWVRQVRDVAYDAEDILDKFIFQIANMRRRRGFIKNLISPSSSIKKQCIKHTVATEIKRIRARFDDIAKIRLQLNLQMGEEEGSCSNAIAARGAYTRGMSSLVEEADIVGIEEKVKQVGGWLLDGDLHPKVISILGMGGLGKTTLAQRIYNYDPIKEHFVYRSWVTVSQLFNKIEILNVILRGFDEKHVEEKDIGHLQRKLHAHLHDKRYLVVLDDVWSEDVWGEVHSAFPNSDNNGSRFVITTRTAEATLPMNVLSKVYMLEQLTTEEAWLLFCKKAFWGESGNPCPLELEGVGRLIVKECEGLPLAIVAIGSMMFKKPKTIHVWDKVHRSLAFELDKHKGVRGILTLSYKDLSSFLKYCFLYCCLFPEDYEIPRSKLIRLWVAEGFIEGRRGITEIEAAADSFKELLDRSLIHVAKPGRTVHVKTIRLHDVVWKLGLSLLEKEMFGTICDGKNNIFPNRIRHMSIQSDDGSNVPTVNEMSCLRTFLMFGSQMSSPSYLRDLLSSAKYLRVLDLQGVHVECLPKEIGDLIHLRYLGLRNAGVKKVPKSLGKLKNLETLDLKGFVGELPREISKIKSLMYLSGGLMVANRSLRVPSGIKDLANLQTLKYIGGNSEFVRELLCLKQMRKLYIELQRSEDGGVLWESIQKMDSLHCLRISCMDLDEALPVHIVAQSPPTTLERLGLSCGLPSGKLPNWVESLPSLSRLVLEHSKLTEDPFLVLQRLPNLMDLTLHRASNLGNRTAICGTGGFPKLHRLVLIGLEEWEEWGEVEEGAMPCLQRVYIWNCRKLRALPQGFQYLTALQLLNLEEVGDEFLSRLERDSGEDRLKVQHIPRIRLWHVRDGEDVFEDL
ncbi:hypothetical protein AMTRI_Chr10g230460 [Amborella trichopoda]